MHEELVKEFMFEMKKLRGVFHPVRGGSGLKPNEEMVLHCVMHMKKDGGKAFPSQIGEEMGLSRSLVAQNLTSLEKLGYISRSTQLDDRRMSEVVLTDKATELFLRHKQGMQSKMSALIEQLGEDDSRELLRLVRRMVAIMTNLNANKEESNCLD